jgi:hypothetical protein
VLVPLAGVRAGRRVDALVRPERAARRVVRRVLDALRAEAARFAEEPDAVATGPERPDR